MATRISTVDDPAAATKQVTTANRNSVTRSSKSDSDSSEDKEKARQHRRNASQTKSHLYWKEKPVVVATHYENKRWHELQLNLARLIKVANSAFFDKAGRSIEPAPITSPEKAFDMVFSRYLKYCNIARNLDNCYYYLIHPQKRELLRTCLISVLSRILELKNELVLIDQREYQFMENHLQSYGWTHADVELKIPLFVKEARAKVLADRHRVLSMLYTKHSEREFSEASLQRKTMTQEEAILLIQRQTRYYIGAIKSEMARQILKPKPPLWITSVQTRVLNKWRIYATRKECLAQRKKLDILLDMVPEQKRKSNSCITLALSTRNRSRMEKNENEYEMDKVALENEMYTTEGPYMAWSIHYTIKQWLLEVRDVLDNFSTFPEEEEGGSLMLFANRDVGDVEDELSTQMVNGKFVFPPSQKKKKPKKEKRVPRKSPWSNGGFEFVLEETDSMREIGAGIQEYNDFWYLKDDSDNPDQVYDRELLKEQLRLVVGNEIRLQVDELIRQELADLVYAVDRVPRKTAKDAKKKKKKEKPEKKNKGDLTANKTIDELFEELVRMEIIRYSPMAELCDFIGDFSYSATVLEYAKRDTLPSLGDVRRMVKEFAILPLSSEALHQKAPLIRKLLIAGVRGTGKKLLLNAICHETGATLFDITPKNLEGKFDTPEGKKMLMHLIMKVGKAMEPSVFWVGECEKMFLKKKDKTDTAKPAQWVNAFQKTLKRGIKNGDRMMLIGTSSLPNLTKQSKFNKFFDRIIIVPYPEYPSRYLAWRHFISSYMEAPLSPYFDLSSLTKVTAGYSISAIKQACETVITPERISRLAFTPIKASEFINIIWMQDPIYTEEQEQFLAWYNNTPLAKQRQLRLQKEGETESLV